MQSDDLPALLVKLAADILGDAERVWEQEIFAWHRENPLSRRLDQIPGIGPLGASALVASIGDVRTFKNGRRLAAWLGLVPRQDSSGGKTHLLGISKRGDRYLLRTLLILGAQSVLRQMKRNRL
jgi:transposase